MQQISSTIISKHSSRALEIDIMVSEFNMVSAFMEIITNQGKQNNK